MKHPVETSFHSDSVAQIGFWYKDCLNGLQECSHEWSYVVQRTFKLARCSDSSCCLQDVRKFWLKFYNRCLRESSCFLTTYGAEISWRSHPKDGEDTVFTGVCPQSGRGTPVSCPRSHGIFQRVPQSRVLSQVSGPGSSAPLPAETEHQSQYLLRGGRYAPCVHAGGFSCTKLL